MVVFELSELAVIIVHVDGTRAYIQYWRLDLYEDRNSGTWSVLWWHVNMLPSGSPGLEVECFEASRM